MAFCHDARCQSWARAAAQKFNFTSHASSGMNRICQLPLLAKLYCKCTKDTAKVRPIPRLHWFTSRVQEKGVARGETESLLQQQNRSVAGWSEIASTGGDRAHQEEGKRKGETASDILQQVFWDASSHPSKVATGMSDTLQLLLTAGLGWLSSNTNSTFTMSRTDTPLLKDSRITAGLGPPKINTFINARKNGWKRLTEEVRPSPAHTAVLRCVF